MATTKGQLALLGLLLVVVSISEGFPQWWQKGVKKPRQVCYIGNHQTVRVGDTWRDRCMKCVCDEERGSVCEGPKCATPYKSYHNKTCIKWSADECCCEQFGCKSDGKEYRIGQYYPYPPGDPCGDCLCQLDADFPKCRKWICPPLVCVDHVQILGECCRRCKYGPNCNYPALKGVDSTNRGIKKPLLNSLSTLIQSDEDPMMFYNCTCKNPGGASVCEEAPFTFNM